MACHPIPWHPTPSHPTAQSSEAARTAMISIMQEGTGQVKELVKEVKKQGEGPLPPSSPDWLKKDFGTWLVENAIDFAGRLASEGGLTFAELETPLAFTLSNRIASTAFCMFRKRTRDRLFWNSSASSSISMLHAQLHICRHAMTVVSALCSQSLGCRMFLQTI